MKSTKFWVALLSAMLVLSAIAAVIVANLSAGGAVANIYQNGECIYSVKLSDVSEPYDIVISGEVANTVSVERGRICVSSATCPDQVCVRQGWISTGVMPVVCLPNGLMIRIENAPEDTIDAVSG